MSMTITTNPRRANVAPPVGATETFDWCGDSRDFEGATWLLGWDGRMGAAQVYVVGRQSADGSVDSGVVINLDIGERLTRQQARDAGEALIAAAEEAEQMAGVELK